MVDCFMAVFLGSTVYFARPDALKGTLNQTMKDAKPTLFLAVPRLWEKMEEKISDKTRELSNLKQKIFRWATKQGFSYTTARFEGRTGNKLGYWIANRLVLKKIRAELGLDHARMVYSGAAPISRKTLGFVAGIGLPICETYGMSESAGE